MSPELTEARDLMASLLPESQKPLLDLVIKLAMLEGSIESTDDARKKLEAQ